MKPLILAIDTSCDETSAAVTRGKTILSNIIWSQASLHARWGGVLPSLAQREHQARIDWVVNKALVKSGKKMAEIGAIAVTVGPCLAVAGQVGIEKAKELAREFNLPLISVNHLEGHILSPLAGTKSFNLEIPAFGLVVSGGHTDLAKIKAIGDYELLATTQDDALGEALDKAARMLGLGYPGGAIMEKMAKGVKSRYLLPVPMVGRESEGKFSYSGLKTAMWRLTEAEKNKGLLTRKQIKTLAYSFQKTAFEHLIRTVGYQIGHSGKGVLLVGGGVAANIELRRELRQMAKKLKIKVVFPYTKKLCTDNAAMIGVVAAFKAERNEFEKNPNLVDRIPRLGLNQTPPWSN